MTNRPLELLLDLTSDPEQSTKAKAEITRRFQVLESELRATQKELNNARGELAADDES